MSSTTNVEPQMLIKSTLHKTKKFFDKSLSNLKSVIPSKHHKQPKTPISPKLQELDEFYTSFSEKCGADPAEAVMKKDGSISETAETKKDGVEEMKEEMRTRSSVAADVLAQKMRDLEMMDLNDSDHALDVEEVLHYYSRLTCPLYVDIVDQFFMDMYSDFHIPPPSKSLHSSMRKLASDSMRSLGPLKL